MSHQPHRHRQRRPPTGSRGFDADLTTRQQAIAVLEGGRFSCKISQETDWQRTTDFRRQRIQGAAESLPAIVAAVAVLVIAWVLAAMTQRVVRFGAAYVVSPTLRDLLRQVAYYSVWAIGVIVALDVAGVDVKSMATGLGLGGVALGFALKDILSNFVSGLLILMSHTFKINDQIVVGDTEGTVERIEVRPRTSAPTTAGWSWGPTARCSRHA